MNAPQNSFSLFLIIWAGRLLSRIGSGISAFALGVYLYQKTGAASAYSFLLLAAFLPAVLLAPVGGVLADRKDRKRMMAAGDLGSSLGILFVIIMFLFCPDRHGAIYAGVVVSSLFAALQSPAFKASVSEILDAEAYAKAAGLIQLAEAAQYLLSPFIAAFLLARFTMPVILAIDMVTFLAAALSVLLIRKQTRQQREKSTAGSFRKAFTDGVRYIAGNERILHLLCLVTVVTFFTGILQSLFVPLVLSVSDAATLGTVQSIAASGMLVSSLFIGVSGRTREQGRVLSLSLLAAGIFYILIGTSPSPVLITCTAFCFFLTLPFVNTSLEVLFRQNIDPAMQGRIWSLISLISQTGMLAAFAIAGPLADHVFNPLLTDTGLFSDTVGRITGTGASRGSGLMIMVSGSLLLVFSVFRAGEGKTSKSGFRKVLT